MNVDTLKKTLLPFFPIEMSYSGRNGSKSLHCQNFGLVKAYEMNVDTLKKPLLPFFPIEMSYTGRNGSKNTGLPDSFSFKNIGNQRRYIQKAIYFHFYQSR